MLLLWFSRLRQTNFSVLTVKKNSYFYDNPSISSKTLVNIEKRFLHQQCMFRLQMWNRNGNMKKNVLFPLCFFTILPRLPMMQLRAWTRLLNNTELFLKRFHIQTRDHDLLIQSGQRNWKQVLRRKNRTWKMAKWDFSWIVTLERKWLKAECHKTTDNVRKRSTEF